MMIHCSEDRMLASILHGDLRTSLPVLVAPFSVVFTMLPLYRATSEFLS